MKNNLLDMLSGIERVQITFGQQDYSQLIKSELNIAIRRGAVLLDAEKPDFEVVEKSLESRLHWMHIGMASYCCVTVSLLIVTCAIALSGKDTLALAVSAALIVPMILAPSLLNIFGVVEKLERNIYINSPDK